MYCTVIDMIEAIGKRDLAQLSNDINPEVVNETLVNNYITDASNLIDGYLRSKYTLPLQNSHTIIKKICIDIVRYELYKRRNNKVYEGIGELYKQSLSSLEKIQKGIIVINEGNPLIKNSLCYVVDKSPVFPESLNENYTL